MKIIAIGRNYQEHAKELNNPIPTEPVVFLKPDTALLKEGKAFYHPDFSNDIHFEVELIIKIGKEGKHIASKFARNYIESIGLGIDFTARDLQQKCKEKGLPWEIAKAFDHSAPIGEFIPVNEIPDLKAIQFSLKQNQVVVQNGNSADMIFSFEEIISYVSQRFTLKKGDLIFTGTPAGVGKINIGDLLEGYISDCKMLSVPVK
ncbi:MAG: fumarylacetoacetate hydrolase family protein [Sphingobacteriaceae bacterium]|jgi:2-keto-4-pentenoate hydratase/2-oxohepta-3-ene-1,7-dioic acid hydratase in catechol pathway